MKTVIGSLYNDESIDNESMSEKFSADRKRAFLVSVPVMKNL